MGSDMSRLESSRSSSRNAQSRGHPRPTKPRFSSPSASEADVMSGVSSSLDSRSRSHSSVSSTASTRSPWSSSSAKPLLYSRPSSDSSRSTPSSPRTLPKSEQRPGKVHNLGILGRYYCNPSGLAGFYDWETEEGGYIPFQHQGQYRKKWRRDMWEAQRETQRERTARFKAVENKKAATRLAYEEHRATRFNESPMTQPSYDEVDSEAEVYAFL